MIDLEKILVIAVASLLLANVFFALIGVRRLRRLIIRVYRLGETIERARKYWRVTYLQADKQTRQTYAMGAGMVVFFVWWCVAIVTGLP